MTRTTLDTSGSVLPWGHDDYMEALIKLAEEQDMDLEYCAKKFGTLTLPKSTNGWFFHPALGFGSKQ